MNIKCLLYLVFFQVINASDISNYILLSAKLANKNNVNIHLNNTVNQRSIGFIEDCPVRCSIRSGKKSKVYMPKTKNVYLSSLPTAIQKTDRELDIAIIGKGYFKVSTKRGTRYTKNGQMHVSQEGMLINTSGNIFLDEQGREIIVDYTSKVVIDVKGQVLQKIDGVMQIIGKIAVVSPTNHFNLQKDNYGKGLIINKGNEVIQDDSSIVQGSLNGSNVDLSCNAHLIKFESQHFAAFDKMISSNFSVKDKALNNSASFRK